MQLSLVLFWYVCEYVFKLPLLILLRMVLLNETCYLSGLYGKYLLPLHFLHMWMAASPCLICVWVCFQAAFADTTTHGASKWDILLIRTLRVNTFFRYISFTCEWLLVPAWYVCECVFKLPLLLLLRMAYSCCSPGGLHRALWPLLGIFFQQLLDKNLNFRHDWVKKSRKIMAVLQFHFKSCYNKSDVSFSYFLLGDTWNWDLSLIVLGQKILKEVIV